MNRYTLIRDLIGVFALFVALPAYIFLPAGFFDILIFPFSLILMAGGIFLYLNKNKIVFDERMARVGSKSHTYAMLITIIWVGLLITLSKTYNLEVLTVPIALYSTILVLVLTSRTLFEIMLRIPRTEG